MFQVPRVQRGQVGRSAGPYHRLGPQGGVTVRGRAEQPSGAGPDCQLQLSSLRLKVLITSAQESS